MSETFIIAEAGINHNADISIAHEMIDAAAAAGVDAVKFQTAIPELVATATAEKARYQMQSSDVEESQLEMIKKMHFPLDVYPELKTHCEERGVLFFSSAFDLVSLDFLKDLGQTLFKIPSGEITNLPYLRSVGSVSYPIILSTGMATMTEVQSAVQILVQEGKALEDITVLHCNTEYPTPPSDVNLRAMLSMRDTLNMQVGYSDHTLGCEVSVAAVALGATVIEKHFTMNRNFEGPDHAASLEPEELTNLVRMIRNVEQCLGVSEKKASPSEAPNKAIARRSIVAAAPIRKGEAFSENNLTAKRPGTGLSPMHWDTVLGKTAKRDYLADDMIVDE